MLWLHSPSSRGLARNQSFSLSSRYVPRNGVGARAGCCLHFAMQRAQPQRFCSHHHLHPCIHAPMVLLLHLFSSSFGPALHAVPPAHWPLHRGAVRRFDRCRVGVGSVKPGHSSGYNMHDSSAVLVTLESVVSLLLCKLRTGAVIACRHSQRAKLDHIQSRPIQTTVAFGVLLLA